MALRKYILLLLLPWVLSCSDSNNEQSETINSDKTYAVKILVNLPFAAITLNGNTFNYLQPTTYTSSTSVSFIDQTCNTQALTFYFLKVAPLAWDLYVFVNQTPTHIQNGLVGSFGQYKASLQFNNQGKLISTDPTSVITVDISNRATSALYVQLDFGSEGETTANASNFAVNELRTFSACHP